MEEWEDGGLLRYRKWVPLQLGDVIKQGNGDSRHGDMAANHNSTHFLVWSTGPLLISFGQPDGKVFLSFLPILLCIILFSTSATTRDDVWNCFTQNILNRKFESAATTILPSVQYLNILLLPSEVTVARTRFRWYNNSSNLAKYFFSKHRIPQFLKWFGEKAFKAYSYGPKCVQTVI